MTPTLFLCKDPVISPFSVESAAGNQISVYCTHYKGKIDLFVVEIGTNRSSIFSDRDDINIGDVYRSYLSCILRMLDCCCMIPGM